MASLPQLYRSTLRQFVKNVRPHLRRASLPPRELTRSESATLLFFSMASRGVSSA